MNDRSNNKPLVVFGFDAGDPGLLFDWAQDGTLPVLRELMRQGCWGRTSGPELISEHGMWVTLTSGVSRGHHGYYYYRQLVPGTYRLAPVRGRDRDAHPFWYRLAGHAKVAIIDVPDIAPPHPQPGIQLSEWATHYPYFPASAHPPTLLDRAKASFGRQMVIHEEPLGGEREDVDIYERLRARIDRKVALCDQLLQDDAFDLIFIVFGECHTGGHQLWKYLPQRHSSPRSSTTGLAGGIKTLYQATDAALGRILRRAGDDANVFVISSVGMKSQYPAAGLGEAFCRQLGYQATPAPSSARGNSPMSLLRRALPRSLRDQASRMLPRTTQERFISDKFESATDWGRTVAFCIPSYYTSFLRVNLRGREPSGIVSPGAEYEDVLSRLEDDLRLLIDPVTSTPAVQYIARSATLFGGAVPAGLPDLFVEWAEAEHFMDRVVHPRAELRQEPCEFHRDSDHSRSGFVAASGPHIHGRGDLGELSPLDLVPTFLHLLNADQVPELPGRPHRGLLGRCP